jgi:hypothetical protein
MTAVAVRGLAALRRKLEAKGFPQALKDAGRSEAEVIARDAARGAPGNLGRTVEVKDVSHGDVIAYAVGTDDPAGRFVEYGTVRQPARPWLWPIFRARLPRIKQNLRDSLRASFTGPRSEV